MNIIPRDNEIRNKIISGHYKNCLVSASAGSGKTTILIERAFSLLNAMELKSYQNVALITFTRLATNQLREKIEEKIAQDKAHKDSDFYLDRLYISTTEAFIISEIINPFLREAYGKNYPNAEQIKHDYNEKFNSFEKGLQLLKESFVLGSYNDSCKNFNYELALKILKNSNNAKQYLKAKYPYIMVDEYQDVDSKMHKLYMYFKEKLGIGLFLVGDVNQILYGFRGANREIFHSLKADSEFEKFQLIENFRSHMSIVNYSYQFIENSLVQVEDTNKVYFYLEDDFNTLLNKIKGTEQEWAYLYGDRYTLNRQKKEWSEMKEFEVVENSPLNSSYPNYRNLEPLLKKYFEVQNYNIYSILEELQLDMTKKNYNIMKVIIRDLKDNPISSLKELEKILNITLLDDENSKFQQTLQDQFKINFNTKAFKKVALTIHKAKGLDFDNVVVHADSFYRRDVFQKENHYVAITRPKKSLHIVMNRAYMKKLSEMGISYRLTNLN